MSNKKVPGQLPLIEQTVVCPKCGSGDTERLAITPIIPGTKDPEHVTYICEDCFNQFEG